jgi:multiple antibiotic resistance protein
MNITDAIKFLVAMIIMLNPLGSMSIFLQLTQKYSFREQKNVAYTSTIAIIIIMLITVWTGEKLLNVLGITIAQFRFAGGIILLLMGLSMLQSKESAVSHTSEDDEAAKNRESIAVVPLALPVVVGPGAISTVIISASDYPRLIDKFLLTSICLILGIGIGLIFYYSGLIAKLVGISVIKVVTRIMGMIIMAIAVGMLAEGLIGLLPILH